MWQIWAVALGFCEFVFFNNTLGVVQSHRIEDGEGHRFGKSTLDEC